MTDFWKRLTTTKFYDDPIVNAHHHKWLDVTDVMLNCITLDTPEKERYEILLYCSLWKNALIKARDGNSNYARGVVDFKRALTKRGHDYTQLVTNFNTKYKYWLEEVKAKYEKL